MLSEGHLVESSLEFSSFWADVSFQSFHLFVAKSRRFALVLVSWFHLGLIIFDKPLERDSGRRILGEISSSKEIIVPSLRGQWMFYNGWRWFKREIVSIYSYSRNYFLWQPINYFQPCFLIIEKLGLRYCDKET